VVAAGAAALTGQLPGGGRSERTAAPVYYGFTVPRSDPATQAALAAEVGVRPSLVGLFVKLDQRFRAADLARQVGPTGMVPLVTLEPWSVTARPGDLDPAYGLASIVRGDHDRAFRDIAEQLRGYGKPVYLRFGHEMNGTWYPWAESVNGNRVGEYVAAWRHVHDLFVAAGADAARWVWAPCVLGGPAGDEARLRGLYPGDRWVDLVGLTGYGHGPSAPQTFDRTLAALRGLSRRPVLLAEVGAEGPDKRQWLRSFGPWLDANPDVYGFVWFNTSPQTVPGATGDYRIDDTAAHLEAFRAMLQGLRRVGTGGS
jgi:glycosyl hydrolase family 26